MKWNEILTIGTVLAFISYVVRLFPVPFGVHSFLLIFLLFIVLTWKGKGDGDFSLFLLASIFSFLILAIYEFLCLSWLMPVFGITPDALFNNLVIRVVIGEPTVLLLFLSAFVLNKLIQKKRLNC